MQGVQDKIFIIPINSEQTTSSGLAISISDCVKGIVKVAGPGLPNAPTVVKEGDTVVYLKGTGTPFNEYDGEPGVILREHEILLIL